MTDNLSVTASASEGLGLDGAVRDPSILALPPCSPPVTAATLAARREALEGRVAALRREQAEAVLAGQKADSAALRAAEADLEALNDAGAVLHQRNAEANRAADAKHKAKLIRAARKQSASWVRQTDEAEAMFRACVTALAGAETARAELQASLRDLGLPAPSGLDPHEQQLVRTRDMSALLRSLTNTGHYGGFTLQTGLFQTDRWTDPDAKLAAGIEHQLKEAENG